MTLEIFARPFPQYEHFQSFYSSIQRHRLTEGKNTFTINLLILGKAQRGNMRKKEIFLRVVCALCILLVLTGGGFWLRAREVANQSVHNATFIMDTVMQQDVYGPQAQEAIEQVQNRISDMEKELSLYQSDSDIARLNEAAGKEAVEVSDETYCILKQAKDLCEQVPDAFALTIAPLTLAWGITTDQPRVLTQAEIDELLPLVDDDSLILQDGQAMLLRSGQAVDLGGIAKGAACDVAREVYEDLEIEHALLNLGGSTIYAKGTKPDGTPFRIGFRDPEGDQESAIVSFDLKDAVFSTSGGYERYFEQDGVRYQHILDPRTGWPAESDILSVGVLSENGAQADFYSTALYVLGKEKTLEYMKDGVTAIMLCEDGVLYASTAFESSLELLSDEYQVVYVE